MTPPVRPEPTDEAFRRWKTEREFRAWKARQEQTREPLSPRRQEALAAITEDINRRERTPVLSDTEESAVRIAHFADALGFGLPGLAIDAMSPGPFREDREQRREAYTRIPVSQRLGFGLLGALGTPGSAVKALGVGAKPLARAGNAMLNAGIQAGAQGTIEGFDEVSREGVQRALGRGLSEGTVGALTAGAFEGARGLVRGGGLLRRVAKAEPLDQQIFKMDDARSAASDVNYGRVRQEAAAAGGTTPEVRALLADPDIKDYADIVRNSVEFRNADDSVVLLEAYKRMSAAQRRAAKTTEGTPKFLADIEQKIRDIGILKGRILGAMDEPGQLPSLRTAVREHAKASGEIEAVEDVSDAILRIVGDRSVRGKKLLLDSPEALRRRIADMTPDEARAALGAVLGRSREMFHLTSNPLTAFNIVPAAVRGVRLPGQVGEFVTLLERRAGTPAPQSLLGRLGGPPQSPSSLLGRAAASATVTP